MEMENLWTRVKKSIKESATFAVEKTEELTKLGKAKIEILAVKHNISKLFTELGGLTYDILKEDKAGDVAKSKEVKALVVSIKNLEKELDLKEKAYEDMKKTVEEPSAKKK
jgi:uncharacterized protein YijF (DUF1287 family)